MVEVRHPPGTKIGPHGTEAGPEPGGGVARPEDAGFLVSTDHHFPAKAPYTPPAPPVVTAPPHPLRQPHPLPTLAQEELLHTWHDPKGFYGWLVTVQNGPIVERLMFTIFAFFVAGGVEALLMRTQLARPENDFLTPRAYNQLFTMHGSTMIFLVAVPMMEAFAEFLLPVMLGSRELPFPRMTAFLYWVLLFGGLMFYGSFLLGQAPDAGWFAYLPLSGARYSPGLGIDFWLLGLDVAQIAALGDAVEMLVSVLKFRAPGMSLSRMPLYVWSVLVMALMIVFGFVPLIMATLLLQMDRHFGTSFFDPQRGGDPVLWQHLFWIFGHPDVYIMFIPATGMVSMIVTTFSRRPIVSYTLLALAIVGTGFLSFGLWVHHMFAVGLPALALIFFTAGSLVIAIPAGIQVFGWIATIWKGRPVFKTPMLFVVGFIITFVIGGLTGPMLAAVPFDLQVHDTFFVVAHFHYVMIGGVIFPMFAGLYYWLPKMRGRMLDERLGVVSFVLIFTGFNVTFFPQHFLGLWGMPRRVYTYQPGLGWDVPNLISTIGAYILGLGVLAFIANWFSSVILQRGRPAGDNPWNAGTLDWATPTPPPHEGYLHIPIVRSREPLWDQPSLDEGDPISERVVRGLAHYPTKWRATVVTSLIDATPQGIVRLAEASIWPLTLAIAVTVIFGAELFSMHPLAIAAGLFSLVVVIVWLWPVKAERRFLLGGDAQTTTLHGLPIYLSGTVAPGWWGMLITITLCTVGSGCLLFSYFYLHVSNGGWPFGETHRPEVLLPTIATALLVATGPLVFWAERGIRRGRVAPVLAGLSGTVLLGTAFLCLQAIIFPRTGFALGANAYSSAFFTIAGWNGVLVTAGVIMAALVTTWAWLGYFNRHRFLAVQNSAFFWYFLIAHGLVVYAVLYLSPYVI